MAVIELSSTGHFHSVAQVTVLIPDSLQHVEEIEASRASTNGRIEVLVENFHDFIWRSLRRLGVQPGDTDDATQQVLLIAARKISIIRSGSERSFLFQTALRVASDYRRARQRRRVSDTSILEDVAELADPTPLTDEIVGLQRARAQLDHILDRLSLDLRAAFILHELDEMTVPNIAELLGVPIGTVASRLRRAREAFFDQVERLSDDLESREGGS